MPSGIQWISGLSRGVATRVALRLFVVLLCVLITLLMAILNFVSTSSDLVCVPFFCRSPLSHSHLWSAVSNCSHSGPPPGKQLHSDNKRDRVGGPETLHCACKVLEKPKPRAGVICNETGTLLHFHICIQTDSLFVTLISSL